MRTYEPMSIEKERRILAFMEQGTWEHSAKTRVIMEMFNVSERQLRELVERCRRAGILIGVGKGGGYFIARSEAEYQDTFRRNCNLAFSALKAQYRALKIYRRQRGQMTIFDTPDDDDPLELILTQIDQLPDPNQPTEKAA